MSQIVWLASYPKSGNTWLRVFLSHFLSNGNQAVDINALEMIRAAGRRDTFDEALGVESSDLTVDEIECLRPAVYRQFAERAPATLYLKLHDANTRTADGKPLIPPDATRGALYVVRNPLDVAISAAHHSGVSVEQSIERLGTEDLAVPSNVHRLDPQLRQRLLSWSAHVLSWLDQTEIPVHLMRYEDMLSQPLETFRSALRFIGLPGDEERVGRALGLSSFESLQRQEQARGFRERPAAATASFFRQGKAGGWREVLTPAQVRRILQDHGAVMQRLGYHAEEDRI